MIYNEKEELKKLLTEEEFVIVEQIANGKTEIEYHEKLYDKLYQYYAFEIYEMPYGTAKARDGDPFNWITERIDNLFN